MSTVPVSYQKDQQTTASRSNPLALIYRIDFILAGTVLLMALAGIMALHGATQEISHLSHNASKQTVFLGIAVVAMFVSYSIDYRWINRLGVAIYTLNFAALIYVLVFGQRISGAKSWIDLGVMNWQPSETMKIATVIVCAQWLALHNDKLDSWKSIFIPGLICGVPGLLVLIQPDFGSATLYFLMFLGMMLMAGAKKSRLALIILSAPMGLLMMYPFLLQHQKNRIISFLNPTRDAAGTGYHSIQSKITVGNGGVFGEGIGNGMQSNHGFLPEHHTDFIFASTVEQVGFLGGAMLLLGYFIIFHRMIATMDRAKDRFGGLVVAGLLSIFMGHIVINIGMNIGIVPITGIPLPLMSYGGTFLVTTFIMMGIVLNVASRRYTFVNL